MAANLARKEADANTMAEELSRETAEMVRANVSGQTRRSNVYGSRSFEVPAWLAKEAAGRGTKRLRPSTG